MPRRKAETNVEPQDSPSMRKRTRLDLDPEPEEHEAVDQTPSKRRRRSTATAPAQVDEEVGFPESSDNDGASSPTEMPRRRARASKRSTSTSATPTPRKPAGPTTPSGRKRAAPVTPSRATGTNGTTPRRRQAADRSARRKSVRSMIERVIRDDDASDEDEHADELEREIFESSEDEDDETEEETCGAEDAAEQVGTPSKPRRGRPPSTSAVTTPTPSRRTPGRPRKARSPTPPPDLPPHERYFLDTKPGRPKTSDNTLASLDLLTHDEYFAIVRGLAQQETKKKGGKRGKAVPTIKGRHADEMRFLIDLHAQSFAQWAFELTAGFAVCLYGFGSKRGVVRRFAEFLSQTDMQIGYGGGSGSGSGSSGKIVVVNGYVRTITPRDIASTIFAALRPKQKPPSAQPAAILSAIIRALPAAPAGCSGRNAPTALTLLVNSVDAPPMRRPSTQALLASLAALAPAVRLVCTADTPDFAMLWDAGKRTALNLVFHDCTTFVPMGSGGGGSGGGSVGVGDPHADADADADDDPSGPSAAGEIDVVDEVHELLGRRARRVGGREGVAFVLRSLPEKARKMFALLVGEVLMAIEEEGGTGGGRDADNPGVEYRTIYNKAVEEFICGNEMGFRTLLKEFYDHQMIVSRTDVVGTEVLSVPYPKDELEAILEDLTGEATA